MGWVGEFDKVGCGKCHGNVVVDIFFSSLKHIRRRT